MARINIMGLESDPFVYIIMAWLVPDPLGLSEARSDPPPAERIGTTSGILFRAGLSSDPDPFLYIRPTSDIYALSFEI